MSDSNADTAATDANAVGCVVIVSGLAVLLALSTLPAALGPMVARRALPVFASSLCPEPPIGAKTLVVSTRSRRSTSTNFYLLCQNERGEQVRASGPKTFFASWLLFNGALVLFGFLSMYGFSRLDRRVTGGDE